MPKPPPVFFSHGFRPLFPGAALFAALAMGLWIVVFTTGLALPTAFAPVDWHAHEFLWGYVGAAIAGFLMTAGANWTGRPPIAGGRLMGLVALWLAGRAAVLVSAALPGLVVAVVDLSFLLAVVGVMGREIIQARNWRNLGVLGLVAVFCLANALFHWEAAQGHPAANGVGARLGIATVLLLIALVGGRIIPAFTRNWLVQRGPGRLPIQFNGFDKAVLLLTGVTLALWIGWPESSATGLLCLGAAAAHLARLLRWTPWRTGAEPLVWVLHAGTAFVPLGFLLVGGAILWPQVMPHSGAYHAWMAGAFAVTTVAVMSRATLGHTGRPLTAGWGVTAVYLALILAALTRIAYGFLPGQIALLHLSATAWIVGFLGFVVLFLPMTLKGREL